MINTKQRTVLRDTDVRGSDTVCPSPHILFWNALQTETHTRKGRLSGMSYKNPVSPVLTSLQPGSC